MDILTSAELQEIIRRIAGDEEFLPKIKLKDLEVLAQELNNYRRELIFQNEELQRTNEKLSAQEKEYRDFFTRAPVPYVIFDLDGRIITANDALFGFFGTTSKSTIGRKLGDFLLPDSNNLFSFFLSSMENNNRGYHQSMKLEFMLKGALIETITYFSVCLNGTQRSIRATIIDVTDINQAQRDLEQERERYQIALESSRDYIFEYDLIKDELLIYGDLFDENVSKNQPLYYKNFVKDSLFERFCFFEDISKIKSLLFGEIPSLEIRLFLEKNTTTTKWFRIHGKAISENQRNVRIIGRIVNINEAKLAEEQLLEKSYQDGLTGLYNPSYGLQLIKKIMQEKDNVSLILFDLSGLSQINENFSFTFGNVLLAVLAEIIKTALKDDGVAVRLGGDEFGVVFESTSKRRVDTFIKKIQEDFSKLYIDEEGKLSIATKVAVVFNKGYQAFEQLLDYMMKKTHRLDPGEICYIDEHNLVLFSKQLRTKNRDNYGGLSPIYCYSKPELSELAFDLLEKTRDIKSAIQILLFLMAKTYDFKHICIYEKDSAYLAKHLMYQWPDKSFENVVHYPTDIIYEELLDFETITEWIEVGSKSLNSVSTNTDNFLKSHLMPGTIIIPIFLNGNVNGIMEMVPNRAGMKWKVEKSKKIIELSKLIATHISRNKSDYANKAKSEFVSKLSHEIRTPLSGIVGFVDIMGKILDELKESEPAYASSLLQSKFTDYLSKIGKSVQFLLAIINNSLEISKIENGKCQIDNNVFSMSELLENIKIVFENQFETNEITFKITADYSENFLIGDMLHINQVLVNLINNALKFTHVNGEVILRITETKISDEVSLLFEVIDNGIGIKEEDIERIFKSFEQIGTATQNGTGLGLSICSNLVELMHGKLKVESVYGFGSRFYFALQLPIASQNEMPNNLPKNFNKEVDRDVVLDFSGKRLLLVEDNIINMEIAKTLLEMKGFTVDEAVDGEIAVEKYAQSSPGYYDIIIMDIRMPKMDGITATKQIRNMGHTDSRTIPILAMTADAFSADVERSISCGMNGHLSKPIDSGNMYRVIAKLLDF